MTNRSNLFLGFLRSRRFRWRLLSGMAAVVAGGVVMAATGSGAESASPATPAPPAAAATETEYTSLVRPLLGRYCLDCHSARKHKGGLNLERFAAVEQARKDVKAWQSVAEMLDSGEMPPRDKPQPTPGERGQLLGWARGFLAAEARARAGDPGPVPVRRLGNAEYDYTVRDLTGVDLRPARDFPADGAAGEGFANAAEALAEVSPTLLAKYFDAAKEVSQHAVLLPDGFRFSPAKTRRDWTDEGTASLRRFYADYAPLAFTASEGRLSFQPYLAATVRHRDPLASGSATIEAVAATEKLNAKYLGILWRALTDGTPSEPLDHIRARWRTAAEKDVPALAAEVTAWQAALWRVVKVGNYVQATWGSTEGSSYTESLSRQVPNDPPAADAQPVRLAVKPAPGQGEVLIRLSARELRGDGRSDGKSGGAVVWRRPRFEAPGKPSLLLKDYPQYGPAYEVDYPAAFAATSKYLAAVAKAAREPGASVEKLAEQDGLDAGFLKRWVEVLAVDSIRKDAKGPAMVPAPPLALLDEKSPEDAGKPGAATGISAWRRKGSDLPVVVANSSAETRQIPGRVPPHAVAVHPTPSEFVAVAWKSPAAAMVRVAATVAHAHPACGNGVAWRLEHRRGDHGEQAAVLAEGAVPLGGGAKPAADAVKVEAGDRIVLGIDANGGDHSCDLTEINLVITDTDRPGPAWDLSADVADTLPAGNPHADGRGNKDVWSFVRGPSWTAGKAAKSPAVVPPGSVLDRWRTAAADPARRAETAELADQVQALLSGPRPAKEKDGDRALYDKLVAMDGPLFQGVDVARLARPQPNRPTFGLPAERFGKQSARYSGDPGDDASLIVAAGDAIEVRLPAALFRDREFVAEGRLPGAAGDHLVIFHAKADPAANQDAGEHWDGKSPIVADPAGPAYRQLVHGYDEFRQLFPMFVCFPQVVPTDEVVTLKMFHREDEPLRRLFLGEGEARRLDRLWVEQRFVSRQPVAEYAYLPQFMGFTTQDTPKAFQQFFIDRKPLFQKQAEAFLKEEEAAVPRQLDALLDFAARAYRRPLADGEKDALRKLYGGLREKGLPHDEAFRAVLARVLVSPNFLLRIEKAPPGQKPGEVDAWELATRLSYFLWSSVPDDALRQSAASGRLREPEVLAEQAKRMLDNDRVRALAIQFGTQWIHVRGFDQLKEKNEQLFPTFDANLRSAIYEESVLFFQDLFRSDRPVTRVLDADYTFLNETLAKHYGIPNVTGPQWRRVDGVKKYGRGGVLGLAAVQATQSGASRTSPVLRGNWVVETLLGEKLPRPPADVPQLPDAAGTDGLTVRQQVERHAKDPACATCHVRMDPFGFALERYDPIGRLRDHDFGGLPLDTHARLRDGTEFNGIEGLRTYLLTKKRDVFVRLFCRRLLGYALGRGVILSDEPLIDEMAAALNRPEGRVSDAVLAIVRSPQFRMIRGKDYPVEE